MQRYTCDHNPKSNMQSIYLFLSLLLFAFILGMDGLWNLNCTEEKDFN